MLPTPRYSLGFTSSFGNLFVFGGQSLSGGFKFRMFFLNVDKILFVSLSEYVCGSSGVS